MGAKSRFRSAEALPCDWRQPVEEHLQQRLSGQMLIPCHAKLLCAPARFLCRFGLSAPPFRLSLRIISEDRVAAFARRDKGRPSRLDLSQSIRLRPELAVKPLHDGHDTKSLQIGERDGGRPEKG